METLYTQFNEMLCRGTLPLFEFEMSNGDYLVVNIQISDKQSKDQGFLFSFDTDNKPVFFDGEIVEFENNNNLFLLPFDDYFDNLDYYFQMISDNITEGYLLPNNLFV
jgi:hypothetical protein